MAKRRTKKNKIIAQLRRQMVSKVKQETQETYQYRPAQAKHPFKVNPTSMKQSRETFDSLFAYDPKLIRKDLLRTVLFACLAFAIEFGIYFYLR